MVGYSINDTVVVFDRIREYLGAFKKRPENELVNDAINSTLSRTINTSLTTIFVLLMIFIFGGDALSFVDLFSSILLFISLLFSLPIVLLWIPAFLLLAKGVVSFF